MNILFTTVKAPEKSPFSVSEKLQPLGIGILTSILRSKGHRIFFFDPYTDPDDKYDMQFLFDNEIKVVGIYVSTVCYKEVLGQLKLLKWAKRLGWEGKIILGGPHCYNAKLSSYPGVVDHIIKGEADIVIVDLMDWIDKNIEIPDRIIWGINPVDLDNIPIPSYDLFEGKSYKGYGTGDQVFTLSTSRGCPYNCMFCSSSAVTGRNYRCMSPSRIIEHIRIIEKSYPIGYIQFRENNFCVNNKRVFEFCELYQKEGFNYPWYAECSVRDLNYDLLKVMKNAGCAGLYIGLESASKKILDIIKRGFTPERNEQTAIWCNQLGIRMYASYLAGMPFEEENDIRKTEEFAKNFNPDGTNWFNVFVGLPGSKLYDDVKDVWYEDDIGLRYGPKHNELVRRFYGAQAERALIDVQ